MQKKDEPLFKQFETTTGKNILMLKLQVTMQAPMWAVIDTITDYERRQKWDKNLFDFKVLYETPCKCYRRIYYAFHSPKFVADRDFYLEEHMRRDYPRPGMCTVFIRSLPPNPDEMPEQGRRIRAKAIIVGFIFTARFDEQL